MSNALNPIMVSISILFFLGCNGTSVQQPVAIDDYVPAHLRQSGYRNQIRLDNVASGESGPLDVQACVRIALSENPMLQASREGVSAARSAVGQAGAGYYPQLDLSSDYRRFQSRAFLPRGVGGPAGPASNIVGPTHDYGAQLTAGIILFDSGRRRAQLEAAKANLEASQQQTETVIQEITFAVHEAFYSLLAARQAVTVAEENLARALDHQRIAEQRMEIGVAVEADVARAKVEAGQRRLDVVHAENLVRIAKGNLNTVMGLPAELPTEVEGQIHNIEDPATISLEQTFDSALSKRPELREAVNRISASQSRLAGAQSDFGPRVRAFGSYGWRDTEFLPGDEEWAVGIGVELPLFTGFSRTHRLEGAKSELKSEQAQTRQLVLEVRQQVWQSHSDLLQAYETLRATELLLDEARTSMKLTQDRYEADKGTITDLMDSQAALAQAEGGYVQSQWRYMIAKAAFERACGQLVWKK